MPPATNHLSPAAGPPSVAEPTMQAVPLKLYPLFADLSRRAVLVVGGGAVAERKVAALLDAGAQVTVNAPQLTPILRGWVEQGRIAHRPEAFRESWLDRVWLVVAATSDRATNALIAELAG